MKKIAEIILDVCVGAWLVFVTASIIMILMTSCSSQYGICPAYSNYKTNTTTNG